VQYASAAPAYDASVPEGKRSGGWWGLLRLLVPFFFPPLIVLLPVVLMLLIAFWIYVWITRDRVPAPD
jgi:hypothetical protein